MLVIYSRADNHQSMGMIVGHMAAHPIDSIAIKWTVKAEEAGVAMQIFVVFKCITANNCLAIQHSALKLVISGIMILFHVPHIMVQTVKRNGTCIKKMNGIKFEWERR